MARLCPAVTAVRRRRVVRRPAIRFRTDGIARPQIVAKLVSALQLRLIVVPSSPTFLSDALVVVCARYFVISPRPDARGRGWRVGWWRHRTRVAGICIAALAGPTRGHRGPVVRLPVAEQLGRFHAEGVGALVWRHGLPRTSITFRPASLEGSMLPSYAANRKSATPDWFANAIAPGV